MLNILVLLIIIGVLIIFIAKPISGLYSLACCLPIIGWSFYWQNFNLPLVDLVALLLLLACLARLIFQASFKTKNPIAIKFPLLLPFGLFLIFNLISSLLSTSPSYSLWYIVRWPLFLYLAYIVIPYSLIINGKILKKTILAIVISSLVVVISGYLSLFGQDWQDSFFRIRSISLAGLYPFGENHNLIAEYLNVGSFLILSYRLLINNQKIKRLLDICFLVTALGIILTFSRAGWITLLLQIMIYAWYYFRAKQYSALNIVLAALGVLILLSPLGWKMNQLQKDNVSSTENRWLLTEISLEAYQNKPYLGYGSGQFINLVSNNIRFTAKYGDPIDSHGVLQKVLAETGVFGLAAWAFILLTLIKISYQALSKYYNKNPWLLPLILAGAGGLFFQFFNTSYYKGKVWLPIALTLAAVRLLDAKETKYASSK